VTTVAFRDGVMAADSMGSDNFGKCRLQKIVRVKVKGKVHLVGIAGFYEAGLLFADWYGGGAQSAYDRLTRLSDDDNFTCLIWTGKKLLTADRLMRLTEVQDDYYAIGSGACYAMTAMDCGKGATQAVQMAIKRDQNSGGRVLTVRLIQ
jgi:hypothetical protein